MIEFLKTDLLLFEFIIILFADKICILKLVGLGLNKQWENFKLSTNNSSVLTILLWGKSETRFWLNVTLWSQHFFFKVWRAKLKDTNMRGILLYQQYLKNILEDLLEEMLMAQMLIHSVNEICRRCKTLDFSLEAQKGLND